jgi:hypothetical protein
VDLDRCPGCRLSGGKFLLCKQKKILLFNFPIECALPVKQKIMYAYRILSPSETDDSRFNSREKHMLTDSVQPYNKPIIDLACSVCTVKYQTSAGFLHGPRSFVARSILKNLGLIC